MRDHPRNDDNLFESLYRTNRAQAQQFEDIWNKLPTAPILKHTTQVPAEPSQGMFIVDPVGRGFCFYLGTEWICLWSNPPVHAIKVYSDKKTNAVANGAFKFDVEQDLADYYVTKVEAAHGTPGSGATTVQISNQTQGFDILNIPLTIASGQRHDNGNAVINIDNSQVAWKDAIWIDVDTVGAGSKGLHVYITFEPYGLEEE